MFAPVLGKSSLDVKDGSAQKSVALYVVHVPLPFVLRADGRNCGSVGSQSLCYRSLNPYGW